MAVTVHGSVTTSALTVASSITFSHTTSSGADGLYVAAFDDVNVAVNSVTFNGDSLTEKWDTGTDGVIRSAGYLMVAPDIGSFNVVVTYASSITGQAFAVGLTGLNQSTPNRTPATALSGGSGPSVSVTSVSGDLVIDAAGTFGASIAVGSGQTSIGEQDDPGTISRSWGVSTETATGTSTTMSWTSGSTSNATGAMALIEAVAEPPAVTVLQESEWFTAEQQTNRSVIGVW